MNTEIIMSCLLVVEYFWIRNKVDYFIPDHFAFHPSINQESTL